MGCNTLQSFKSPLSLARRKSFRTDNRFSNSRSKFFLPTRVTKTFQYPFSIGKHLLVLNYANKRCELRIDNNTFDSLFDGKLYNDNRVMMNQYPAPSQAPVQGGWDQLRSMQGRNDDDDIPDGYDNAYEEEKDSSDEEEEIEKEKAQEFFDKERATRAKTISKQTAKKDEFDWDAEIKTSNKKPEEAFEMGGQADPFDFDFGKQKSEPVSSVNQLQGVFDTAPVTTPPVAVDPFSAPQAKPQPDPFLTGPSNPQPDPFGGLSDVFSNGAPPAQPQNDVFGGQQFSNSGMANGGVQPQAYPESQQKNPFAAFQTSNNPTGNGLFD